MPLAQVDDHGIALYYEDSGAPTGSSNYTTLVLIHGALYNNGIYRRMFQFAGTNNLRLIIVNQRDYHPSSPLTSEELALLTSPELTLQDHGLRRMSHQIAKLLVHIVDVLQVPPMSETADGRRQGGISFLGWSLSTFLSTGLLAHADSLPTSVKVRLEPYLRSVVIYDGALMPLGDRLPPMIFEENVPKGYYWPHLDMSISVEERMSRFLVWLSSYYPKVTDLSAVTTEVIGNRVPLHDLVNSTTLIPTPAPTASRIPPDITDFAAFALMPTSVGKVDTDVPRWNTHRALHLRPYPSHPDFTPPCSIIWPSAKVVVVWSEMDMNECILAAASLSKKVNAGTTGREVRFVKFEGANHFAHWDEPERTTWFLSTII
ncbi:hypothetical protein K474DRAFT_1645816 [Panus rudis PR-1116 ss-1]|nr:hypothetical protein K474DRAFT_1645816 [Panus rudis PR-1116 ss-1]